MNLAIGKFHSVHFDLATVVGRKRWQAKSRKKRHPDQNRTDITRHNLHDGETYAKQIAGQIFLAFFFFPFAKHGATR